MSTADAKTTDLDLVSYLRDVARGAFPTEALAHQSAYWLAAEEIETLRSRNKDLKEEADRLRFVLKATSMGVTR